MAEYIEREKLLEIINSRIEVLRKEYGDFDEYTDGIDECIDRIEDFPAADVAPVRHGEWEIVIGSNGKEYMVCTCCRVSQDLTGVFSYCPNCGAKMDGGDGNSVMS